MNGRSEGNWAAAPTGRKWPNAAVAWLRLSGCSPDVTDVGFGGRGTEKGRLPPNPAVGGAFALATFNGRFQVAGAKPRSVEAHQKEHKANSQDPAAAKS